ncbi:MAG: hypothetical protein IT430_06020 [Phycisphaerales bacterium]|nr:hypothetical protein [Phycisphaerales bacterium]
MNHRTKRSAAGPSRLALLTVMSAVTSSASLRADDCTWINPLGGVFGEPANWDTGTIPGMFDRSIFDLSAVYAVALDADAHNEYVLVRHGQVTLDLNGFIFRNRVESGGTDHRLVVGEQSGDDAALLITGGLWEAVGDIKVGWQQGSMGELEYRGSGTSLTGYGGGPSNDRVFVGEYGNGTLRITDGALCEYELVVGNQVDSAGHAVISGPGSMLRGRVYAGLYGQGRLEILDGASITSLEFPMVIGQNGGSYGETLISGAGTTYIGDIRTGYDGEGHLTLSAGASMDGNLFVGDVGVGFGTAHVSGVGTLLSGDTLTVGGTTSMGSLLVSSGGSIALDDRITVRGTSSLMGVADPGSVIECRTLHLGPLGGGNQLLIQSGGTVEVTLGGTSVDAASVVVTDPGSRLSDNSTTGLRINSSVSSGEGMTIANGGAVQARRLLLGAVPEGSIVVTDPGSTLTATGSAELGVNGPGLLSVINGASACINELILYDSGTVEGEITVAGCGVGVAGPGLVARILNVAGAPNLPDTHIDVMAGGTLIGDGTLFADVSNHDGRVDPGDLFDVLKIVGDYTQARAAGMTSQFRGRYQGEYGRLDVVGRAILDGELLCQISRDVDFEIGNQMSVLTANEIQGQFSSVRFSRPNGQRPEVTYEPNEVTITVARGIALDASDLHKGQDATVTITNSRPNTPTYLIYSLTGLGETEIPQLGITCGVRNPKLGPPPQRTNAQGEATFVVRVPVVNGNPRVWLQAVQMHDASGVLQRTIRD